MTRQKGTNNQDVKRQNKLLILKMIATGNGLSRVDIANTTGLTKMTVGNPVSYTHLSFTNIFKVPLSLKKAENI